MTTRKALRGIRGRRFEARRAGDDHRVGAEERPGPEAVGDTSPSQIRSPALRAEDDRGMAMATPVHATADGRSPRSTGDDAAPTAAATGRRCRTTTGEAGEQQDQTDRRRCRPLPRAQSAAVASPPTSRPAMVIRDRDERAARPRLAPVLGVASPPTKSPPREKGGQPPRRTPTTADAPCAHLGQGVIRAASVSSFARRAGREFMSWTSSIGRRM